MSDQSLIRPLFDGPLDILGDVHGEIDALRALMGLLRYRDDGSHPDGRRLVFVGDLTDRGPDSPAVVALVESLIDQGRAQCVLGNHEVNLLLGKARQGNGWFRGEPEALGRDGLIVPQVLADDAIRRQTLSLFRRQPLALERPDLRVVHACWREDAIEAVRGHADAAALYRIHESAIVADLDARNVTEKSERSLAQQNGNPVKVLSSGLEARAPKLYYAAGKIRSESRVAWWRGYDDSACVVFGHYWRQPMDDDEGEPLFDLTRLHDWLVPGRAICIDYSVGKRWRERAGLGGTTALAALRWPERILVTDRGGHHALAGG